MEKHQES